MPVCGKLTEVLLNMRRPQLTWMFVTMKTDKLLDPLEVCFLGPISIMLGSKNLIDDFDELPTHAI